MPAPIIKHAEFEDTYDEPAHPIPSLGVLDVWAPKKTGGADLIIVVASPLHNDEHSRDRLLKKLEGYLGFIKSKEFLAEVENPTPENTFIIVKLHPESDTAIRELLGRSEGWVSSNGATLRVEGLE